MTLHFLDFAVNRDAKASPVVGDAFERRGRTRKIVGWWHREGAAVYTTGGRGHGPDARAEGPTYDVTGTGIRRRREKCRFADWLAWVKWADCVDMPESHVNDLTYSEQQAGIVRVERRGALTVWTFPWGTADVEMRRDQRGRPEYRLGIRFAGEGQERRVKAWIRGLFTFEPVYLFWWLDGVRTAAQDGDFRDDFRRIAAPGLRLVDNEDPAAGEGDPT